MRQYTKHLCVAIVALLCAASSARAEPEAAANAPSSRSAPVVFRDETLFDIAAPLGALDQVARAKAIGERLSAASTDGKAEHEVRVEGDDVLAGTRVIVSVTEADALPTGRTRRQLVADRAARIATALERDRRDRSIRGVAIGAGYSVAVTIAFFGLLWVVMRGSKRLEAALLRLSSLHLDRRFAWLGPANVAPVLRVLVQLVRVVVILVLAYVYADLVLNFFPWTRGIAEKLFGYIRSALAWAGTGTIDYLPKLAYIVVTVLVVRYVLKLAQLLFDALQHGRLVIDGFYADWAEPSYNILRFLILALTAVIIFPYLPGSSSPAFRGISVFLGVLFSIGSASSIGNLVSGVVITYMRPFQIGDRVQLGDTIGDIVSKNLLVVRIRTIKNVEITVPNALVLGNHIVNFTAPTREQTLILHTSVTIGYDAPWRQIHELLLEAANGTDGLLSEPAPFVLQKALDDFYVEYEINAHTKRATEMVDTYSRLHQRIQDAFNAAGVEIMSPHFTAARDGNRIAIPDANVPKGYVAPAFRIDRGEPR
ncbi:MAG: mechanosensitive ion channel family protein [Polyangia bacterium]